MIDSRQLRECLSVADCREPTARSMIRVPRFSSILCFIQVLYQLLLRTRTKNNFLTIPTTIVKTIITIVVTIITIKRGCKNNTKPEEEKLFEILPQFFGNWCHIVFFKVVGTFFAIIFH